MEGTVGEILKAQREALHLTVEEVAAKTSYRADHIEYLERDDFSCFKTAAYAKGTIRGYGNFLGLDGVELVEYFKANQMAQAIFGENADSGALDAVSKSKLKLNLVSQPGVGTQTNFNKDSSVLPFRQIAIGVVLVLVILGGCYFVPGVKFDKANFTFVDDVTTKITGIYETLSNLVYEHHDSQRQEQTVKEQKPVVQPAVQPVVKPAVKPVVKPVVQPQPAPKKVDKNAIAARYDKVVVEMTASGQCWIDVFADGKAVYSGMMSNGRYKIFEANKRITVRYGNIGVMQVIVNGKPVNMKGEAGVATRHYPK